LATVRIGVVEVVIVTSVIVAIVCPLKDLPFPRLDQRLSDAPELLQRLLIELCRRASVRLDFGEQGPV